MTALPCVPLRILDLGPYLLHDICTMLCRHCRPKVITLGWQENCSPEGDDPSYNLASLSRTCRLLRDIAQPILYHDVDPPALMPFLRTVLARPDLAGCVHSFSNSRIGASQFTAEDRPLIRARARAAGVALPRQWAVSESQTTHRDIVDGLITEHLLGHLPRLTNLHHTRIGYPSLGRLLEPAGLVLGSLQKLELGQWDVEKGFALQFDSQGPLLAAAPNLRCLKVHLCARVEPGLPLQNLKILKITNSCLSESSLDNLVSACPNLEGFGYDTALADTFIDKHTEISPGAAQRILRARKSTLRYLDLDFGSNSLLEFGWRAEFRLDYMDSFQDFQVLEKLVISLVWIRGAEVPGNDALVSILPGSIRLLAIPCEGRDGLLHGLVKVAVAVAQGWFPHLRTVQFDLLAGASEEIAQACAIAGIEGGSLQAAFNRSGVECCHSAEFEEFLDFP